MVAGFVSSLGAAQPAQWAHPVPAVVVPAPDRGDRDVPPEEPASTAEAHAVPDEPPVKRVRFAIRDERTFPLIFVDYR